MARLDMETYRETVLADVERCFLDNRDEWKGISSNAFYSALRNELNRSEADTWMVEAPNDLCVAVDEAAYRMLDHMEHNKDLGYGMSG